MISRPYFHVPLVRLLERLEWPDGLSRDADRAWAGRPITIYADPYCPHDLRVLGTYRYSNGAGHVCDFCARCFGRSATIAAADLALAGIDAGTIPIMVDNAPAAP